MKMQYPVLEFGLYLRIIDEIGKHEAPSELPIRPLDPMELSSFCGFYDARFGGGTEGVTGKRKSGILKARRQSIEVRVV